MGCGGALSVCCCGLFQRVTAVAAASASCCAAADFMHFMRAHIDTNAHHANLLHLCALIELLWASYISKGLSDMHLLTELLYMACAALLLFSPGSAVQLHFVYMQPGTLHDCPLGVTILRGEWAGGEHRGLTVWYCLSPAVGCHSMPGAGAVNSWNDRLTYNGTQCLGRTDVV
jgi:hypothetical protein